MPIREKAFFSELTAGRIFPDFPAIIKVLFCALIALQYSEQSVIKEPLNSIIKIPNCFLFSQISISV